MPSEKLIERRIRRLGLASGLHRRSGSSRTSNGVAFLLVAVLLVVFERFRVSDEFSLAVNTSIGMFLVKRKAYEYDN